LQHGLEQTDAELVAVFDADFMPGPDFLERTVGHFADPRVGFVQARWTFVDRNDSLVSRAAALMLDVHFGVEQRGRAALGCFVSFNGTAGVWRTEAIRQAGGWRADTLTEDLDLSVRAQLEGWRVVYDAGLMVRSEVPSRLGTLRVQQYRWMKGVAQNARRLLPGVLRAGLPPRVRLFASAHLLESSAYLAFSVLLLLSAPMVWLAATGRVPWPLAMDPVIPLLLLVPVYRQVCGRGFVAEYLGFLAVTLALAPSNAMAVLDGLFRDGGEFIRTPKRTTETATRS
jgi:cellulose synthase/poly-beta-1,6-N-acetylglucosamine synthase-like glycosyltransferase